MNIHVGTDWVAEWSYHLPVVDAGEADMQWLRLAREAGPAIEHLYKSQLLQLPLSFVLELWEIGRPPQFTRSVVEQWKFVTPTISSLLTGVRQWGTLDIHGSSVIASPLGERALQGVLGLTVAAESFGNSISIWTRSDVWMPYDLQARPHPEVAALNAPRLKAALEAVERMLGVTALSEDTRFAKVDGYELRNHNGLRRCSGLAGHGLRRVVDRRTLARFGPGDVASPFIPDLRRPNAAQGCDSIVQRLLSIDEPKQADLVAELIDAEHLIETGDMTKQTCPWARSRPARGAATPAITTSTPRSSTRTERSRPRCRPIGRGLPS
ncbi:MAG: hypothetical protein R3F43_00105 [bacterium]